MASPGANPAFAPSVPVSDYIEGPRTPGGPNVPLQVNPPNLPMFQKGTAPFIGDYVDVTAAPNFVVNATGKWSLQHRGRHARRRSSTRRGPTTATSACRSQDRRTATATPGTTTCRRATPAALPASSIRPRSCRMCIPGNAGSRNQNVYTARITGGLLVGSPGNTKTLGYRSTTTAADHELMQRSFVVFAQNTRRRGARSASG